MLKLLKKIKLRKVKKGVDNVGKSLDLVDNVVFTKQEKAELKLKDRATARELVGKIVEYSSNKWVTVPAAIVIVALAVLEPELLEQLFKGLLVLESVLSLVVQ